MLLSDAGQSPTQADPHGTIPSNEAAPLHYAVLDIETQRGPDELPTGWDGMRNGEGGLSAACLYDSETNWVYYYSPLDGRKLADDLEAAGVVVTYNGKGFDIPALEGHIGRKIKIDTHIDLLDMLVTANGGKRSGLSLDNVGKFTVGRGKSGTGAQAPDQYKAAVLGGDSGLDVFTKLLNYNGGDVRLTRDLLLFAQQNGFLVGPHGPIHLTLPGWFGRLK